MTSITRMRPWDPIASSTTYWKSSARMWEIWWTRMSGKEAIDVARQRRFNTLVRFARDHSPFYREAYRGLPERDLDPRELPTVTKAALMARFNDWVTDTEINWEGVTEFIADRKHIGERYLDRYVVWKSSGSTGKPGIYVQDSDALVTFDALMAVQLGPVRFAVEHSWDLLARGSRAALVAATGAARLPRANKSHECSTAKRTGPSCTAISASNVTNASLSW